MTTAPFVKTTAPLEPVQKLMDALRGNGWKSRPIANGAAVYFHPTFGAIEIRVDLTAMDRAVPFVDDRQVSFKYAMRLAVGEI